MAGLNLQRKMMKMKAMVILGILLVFGLVVPAYANADSQVLLTDAELDYLERRGPVRMVVDPDWYPYEMIDETVGHRGIAADLVSLISSRTGLDIELMHTDDWEESLNMARSGEADIVSLLNKTDERDEWLIFSEPYFIDKSVLITREEHGYISNLERLTGETVVLPKGTSVEERLRRDYPNLDIAVVESEEEALVWVDRKKSDMTLRSITMAAYVINEGGYFNLKIAGEVEAYTNYLRIGITKDDVVLQGILNKGIASISEQEAQTAINNHISIKVMKGFDYRLFFIVFGIFTFLLTSSFFWLRKIQRLNKSLEQRQQELVMKSEKLAASEALYTSILRASPDAIVLSGKEGKILMLSPSSRHVLGLRDGESVEEMTLMDFIAAAEHDKVERNMRRIFDGEFIGQTNYNGVTKDARKVIFEVNSEVIRDDSQLPISLVSIVRDVTEKVATQEALKKSENEYRQIAEKLETQNIQLQEIASVDALTGLLNRHSINHCIEEEMERANRYGGDISLLLIDLDHFKRINDIYGHAAGDGVLRTISAKLKNALRKLDSVARWGGEEFLVLLPGINTPEAVLVGEKLRREVENLVHQEKEIVTISIGISTWFKPESMETWFIRTDGALYQAKQGGRNQVRSAPQS